MEEKYLSHLLPYDTGMKKHGCLRKSLKEYQALLRAFLEATNSLQAGDLEKFDGLVGENACEIRAVWIAIIASKEAVDAYILNDLILTILKKVEVLLAPSSIDLLMLRKVSLKDLLEKEKLDLSLTNEEMIIVLTYLLSEMKIVKNSGEQRDSLYIIEVSDPKKFIQFGEVTISFAAKLLSKIRRMLATASVQFVRSYACRFQDQYLMRMVSEEFTALQNILPCTPMFWTCKVVLRAAQVEGVPLVIHAKFIEKNEEGYAVVDEDYMVFESASNGTFTEVDPDDIDLEKPACIVQGVVSNENGQNLTKDEWKELMRETSVVDVILAGAADHRQFPDKALDFHIEKLQDSEYESYKAMAKRNGFSDENPTTFFIQHVYAACVGKIVKRMPAEHMKLAQLQELAMKSSIPRPTVFEGLFVAADASRTVAGRI